MSNRQNEVRELLDVVVRDDARAVRFDAADAWRRGRRRRITDALSVVAAFVVLIGIGLALTSLVFGMTPALTPASSSEEVATKHPERLEFAYWDDDLPDVTGPLAGVVRRNGDELSGWYAVSPEGHLWRLDMEDDIEPALSPDGSHLGYMPGSIEAAVYTITNQVEGTSVTFPQIGTGADSADGSPTSEYFFSMQSPAFWSPKGNELVLRISETARRDADPDPIAAILGTDGSFTPLARQPGPGGDSANPVGWIDEDRVALVSGSNADREVRVWVVNARSGESERSFVLEKGNTRPVFTSQWFGRLSPRGDQLVTARTNSIALEAPRRLYSMVSNPPGALTEALAAVPGTSDVCSPSWTSSDLYLPAMSLTDDDDRDDAAVLVSTDGEATIVADPRLNIVCSVWTQSALEGGAHESWGSRLFGKDNSWLSWHWREVSLSVLLAIGLIAGVVLVRHRRWRMRST